MPSYSEERFSAVQLIKPDMNIPNLMPCRNAPTGRVILDELAPDMDIGTPSVLTETHPCSTEPIDPHSDEKGLDTVGTLRDTSSARR